MIKLDTEQWSKKYRKKMKGAHPTNLDFPLYCVFRFQKNLQLSEKNLALKS